MASCRLTFFSFRFCDYSCLCGLWFGSRRGRHTASGLLPRCQLKRRGDAVTGALSCSHVQALFPRELNILGLTRFGALKVAPCAGTTATDFFHTLLPIH